MKFQYLFAQNMAISSVQSTNDLCCKILSKSFDYLIVVQKASGWGFLGSSLLGRHYKKWQGEAEGLRLQHRTGVNTLALF